MYFQLCKWDQTGYTAGTMSSIMEDIDISIAQVIKSPFHYTLL